MLPIDCLLTAPDAHMFGHEWYGRGTKLGSPGPGPQLLGLGPGSISIMAEHVSSRAADRQSMRTYVYIYIRIYIYKIIYVISFMFISLICVYTYTYVHICLCIYIYTLFVFDFTYCLLSIDTAITITVKVATTSTLFCVFLFVELTCVQQHRSCVESWRIGLRYVKEDQVKYFMYHLLYLT